jgi:hypothetical protein
MAEENKGGRPLKFKSAKELQGKIDDYFKSCHNDRDELIRPYTITGLALFLDTTRQTLLEYETKHVEYIDTIKRAKLKIENFAEESLFTSKQTAGVIFNLVNNHKWINRQEVESNNLNNNLNQDVTNLPPDERRARIDELNRRRGIGANNTS